MCQGSVAAHYSRNPEAGHCPIALKNDPIVANIRVRGLLITKRLNRIQAGGFPGGVITKQDPDRYGYGNRRNNGGY